VDNSALHFNQTLGATMKSISSILAATHEVARFKRGNTMLKFLIVAFLPIMIWLSCPSAFGDIILVFDGLGLTDGDPIPQSYGDTLQVDVSYRGLDGFGNAVEISNLAFWTTGYGSLTNVVWGLGSPLVGEIRFDSLNPVLLTLNSFDAADWDGSANDQTFRVYDGNYILLFELTDFDVDHVSHSTITPYVSATSLILQWDYPYGVALDNVWVSVTAVPEPSSLYLVALSSMALIVLRRTRSRHKPNVLRLIVDDQAASLSN
jgi:hypothetical protein